MNFRKLRSFAGTAGISAIAIVVATAAHAQDAPAASVVPAANEANTNFDNTPIIVTGSRIARPETADSNPVVSVGAQRIQEAGTTNVTTISRPFRRWSVHPAAMTTAAAARGSVTPGSTC